MGRGEGTSRLVGSRGLDLDVMLVRRLALDVVLMGSWLALDVVRVGSCCVSERRHGKQLENGRTTHGSVRAGIGPRIG